MSRILSESEFRWLTDTLSRTKPQPLGFSSAVRGYRYAAYQVEDKFFVVLQDRRSRNQVQQNVLAEEVKEAELNDYIEVES